MPDDAEDRFGPIDYVVVEFPGGAPTPAGFELLLELVDRHAVRILDLEFVVKQGGEARRVDASTFSVPALAAFAGASSGLLGDDDLTMLAEELAEGAVALVLVYEELSMLAVLDAWTAEGGHPVEEGQLTPIDLSAALDAADA